MMLLVHSVVVTALVRRNLIDHCIVLSSCVLLLFIFSRCACVALPPLSIHVLSEILHALFTVEV